MKNLLEKTRLVLFLGVLAFLACNKDRHSPTHAPEGPKAKPQTLKVVSKRVSQERLKAFKKKAASLKKPKNKMTVQDVAISDQELKEFLKTLKEIQRLQKEFDKKISGAASPQVIKDKTISHQQEINKRVQEKSNLSLIKFRQISRILQLNQKARQRLAKLQE